MIHCSSLGTQGHHFVPEACFLRDVVEAMSVGIFQELSNTENIMAMFSMRPTTWTAKKGCKEATRGEAKGETNFCPLYLQ